MEAGLLAQRPCAERKGSAMSIKYLLPLLAGTSIATAQQILEVDNDTLTTMKLTAPSSVQDALPRIEQRGVHVDGSLRQGGLFGAKFSGGSGEGWNGRAQLKGSMWLDTGTVSLTEIDLALPADGVRWIVGRSYNNRQDDEGSHHDSNGYQGRNWFQLSQPEILVHDDDADSGTRETEDKVYIIYGADRFIELDRVSDDSDTFKAMNGAAGAMLFEAGATNEPDTYTYYDQTGLKIVFFGFDADASPAGGQLWKIIRPIQGGTDLVAYVGDATTGSTAITNGFDASGRIEYAYDSEDRRYTYTYTTMDSVDRLTEVKAETKTGGTWASPTGLATVGEVDYDYYETGDNTYGDNGCLKQVVITTPLTDSGVNLERKQHYRYYLSADAYNASTNPGHGYALMYIVDAEGYRQGDIAEGGTPALDDGVMTYSESNLKPYTSAYFEYDTSRRINEAYFNGDCGCGGGANGTHYFSYGSNGSYSDTSGYTTTWARRTVMQRPDGTYETQYFDEAGGPISLVVTDSDPSTGSPDTWATEIVRNSDGQITEIRSPAANSTYTHSTGAFTANSGAGLITMFTRVSSGNMKGFIEDRKHQKGTSGSAYLDSTVEYDSSSLTVGDTSVIRPVVDASWVYEQETTTEASAGSGPTGARETTMAYTFWTGSSILVPKKIVTTLPAVSSSNNGSGSSATTTKYVRKEGTTAFSEDNDGVFHYSLIEGGVQTKSIRDAQTNHGSDFASGDDPNTTWGITESADGLRLITTMTYDAQGRNDTTTLPSARVTKRYYSQLGDERLVSISIPKYVSGTGTFHGPISYSVSNHVGKPDVTGTIAFSGGTTTTALTGWIDETDDDPITAVDTGTLEAMSVMVYNETGGRVDERRAYHTIPASGAGSSGTNYDASIVGYDDMGRQWRSKTPAGTIQRTVFDALGRATESWTGTNDSSFSGGEASGTDNMVKVATTEYDGGADGGNSLVTKRSTDPDGDWTAPNNDVRETSFTHDVRGRVVLVDNPLSPHSFVKYDNMGRQVAVGLFSSTASITVSSDDPTTETANRLALSEISYDERGQVWKTIRHKIDASDGSDDDTLESLSWFDDEGRLIKTDGEQLAKFGYDRIGRRVRAYVLADDNDSAYADMDDVTGDVVVEQTNTAYEDDTGLVLMTAVIGRHHDDYGGSETTGALDTNADADELAITAANVTGRVQITAMWYDDLDRLEDTVAYGTNAIVGDGSTTTGTFDRDGLSVPTRSDTALRTTQVYNDDGTLLSVTDPRDLETRYEYDDLGRQITVIANYVNGTPSGSNGDDDLHTRYAYTSGMKTKMWVDIDGDGTEDAEDQVTTWDFGTTKGPTAGQSQAASEDLLEDTAYPDSSGGSDVVALAYNALGAVIYQKDQSGNVIETEFDDAGRVTARKATTVDADFDGTVKRIETAYDDLGRVETVTQYDAATSGNVVDQVKYTYDGWGNVTKFEQDLDSTVATGGNHLYDVDFTYTKATDGRNTIRTNTMNLPDGTQVTYGYVNVANSAGSNADLSRVSKVTVGLTVVANYEYTGTQGVVGVDYPEPDAFYQRYAVGASTGVYANIDRFNRVTSDLWTKDLTTDVDFYDLDISYDRNSNITDTTDNIHLSSGGNRAFDVLYTIDDLDRLTKADEGTLSGGSISNRTRQEVWTLDQVGNWDLFRMDLNGDIDFSDAGELDDDRTHNAVNELTGRDIDDNGSDDYTLVYDEVGNLIDDNENYKYKYDVWGRLMEVKNQSDTLIAEYDYNGLGYRVHWHYDVDADGTLESTSDDPDYYFVYDTRWRIVATYRETDSDPKEQFVYHNAGLGGSGSGSYIDEVILRDRDDSNGWSGAADGTLEERIYYCQNWRSDVSAIVNDAGEMVEWAKYSSYGVPFGLPAADTDADGDCDTTDLNQINTWISSGYDVRGDIDLDGDVDISDLTKASSGPNGETLGRRVLSRYDVASRTGFAGLQIDGNLQNLHYERTNALHTSLRRLSRSLNDDCSSGDAESFYDLPPGLFPIIIPWIPLDPIECSACVASCDKIRR